MLGMGRGSGRLARPSRPLLMEAPIDAARRLPNGTPRAGGIGEVARVIGQVASVIGLRARVIGLLAGTGTARIGGRTVTRCQARPHSLRT